MKLQVRVRLSLHKFIKELVLSYNTYEKATFDQYLIASIVQNSKDQSEAYQLIDDISGDGSLNSHFKKIHQDTLSLKDDEIKSILENSLYPIVKYEKIPYEFYPLLNSSVFQNIIYQGDIEVKHDFAKLLIPANGNYLSSSVNSLNQKDEDNNYNVIFEDDTIKIELKPNQFVNISEESLKSCIKTDVKSLADYKGEIAKNITSGNWNQLNNSLLNNLINSLNYYIEDGSQYTITNEGVKKTVIANYFGVYLYREELLNYDYKNKEICEKVIDTLMANSKINEFKTKALISILHLINPDKSVKVVDYILQRKESKELSEFGIKLVERGFEKGWSEESIKSFKKFASQPVHMVMIYKLNPNLNYTIDDLIQIYRINRLILLDNHIIEVEEYNNDRNMIIAHIERLTGEMTAKGFREVNRRFTGKEHSDYNKQYNKLIAHGDNIHEYSDEKLKNHQNKIEKLYNLYKKLQSSIESEQLI